MRVGTKGWAFQVEQKDMAMSGVALDFRTLFEANIREL